MGLEDIKGKALLAPRLFPGFLRRGYRRGDRKAIVAQANTCQVMHDTVNIRLSEEY